MKMNLLNIVPVVLLSVCAGPAPGLLQRMQAGIASMGCVEISVSFQGNDASVVSDGSRYHLVTDAMEVWCDGTDQWICSSDNNELTITGFDAASADISDNPAVILTSDITRIYNVISESGGQIVLRAKKNVRTSYPGLSIRVDASGLPQLISLTSSAGETYQIKVLSVRSVQNPSSVSFTPSESVLEKSFVNDLR